MNERPRALFSGLFGSPRRRDRLAGLRASGRAVELGAVDGAARVVEIDIGFGRELWQVPPGALHHTPDCAIEGGLLVVTSDRPATATQFSRATGRRPEHIPTRI